LLPTSAPAEGESPKSRLELKGNQGRSEITYLVNLTTCRRRVNRICNGNAQGIESTVPSRENDEL